MNSYVKNCHIITRAGAVGPLFRQEGDKVIAALDGYAIMPVEQLRELQAKAGVPLADAD